MHSMAKSLWNTLRYIFALRRSEVESPRAVSLFLLESSGGGGIDIRAAAFSLSLFFPSSLRTKPQAAASQQEAVDQNCECCTPYTYRRRQPSF